MRGNNGLTILKEIHNIEYAKCKYFIIGFIISLIPYLLVIAVASKIHVSRLFMISIIIITLLSSFINGIILSNNIYHKLISFFENKYEGSYKEIKESSLM